MKREDSMQSTSLWLRLIVIAAVSLPATSYAIQGEATKPVLVEVRSGGDDGLTLRFRDSLENAFRSSRDFSLNASNTPATLVITIPQHVNWKQAGKRTRVLYVVEFTSSENQSLGIRKGSCWDDRLEQCAAQVVRDAQVMVRKLHD